MPLIKQQKKHDFPTSSHLFLEGKALGTRLMIFTSSEVDVKTCSTINSIFIFSLGKTATLRDMSLRILKPVISIQSTDSNKENSITSFALGKEKHLC